MLLFLVFCTFLQTLRGASVPPDANSPPATARAFGLMAREGPVAPNEGERQYRTVHSIIQTCFLTIFVCVWKSAHPNINGPRDSWWTCTKRKVVTIFCVLVVPEMVLLWALRQRLAAKIIAEKYNEEFAVIEKTDTYLWEKIVGLFKPLPEDTTRRGVGQSWTSTHGFFIQMGGFIRYENEYPREVLDYTRLAELLRKKAIDVLTVTERDLRDRSKGDAVSKAIVVLQTTWFVVHCIARAAQRLPLSELEVFTLAFVVINVAIYTTWWNKPQGVEVAICVPEKREITISATSLKGEDNETRRSSTSKSASFPPPEYRLSNDSFPLIPTHKHQFNISTGEKDSWLRRMLRKDCKRYILPFVLIFRLSYRIAASMFHFLAKMAPERTDVKKGELRVPMFYAMWSASSVDTVIVASAIGTLFGAIHLLSWASEFPSPHDLVLWRISGILLAAIPFVAFLASVTDTIGMTPVAQRIGLLFVVLIPFYIASRFVVIIVALKAIRYPPHDVLRDVSWTSYIPHF
ncbi:hypothetical protein D9619_010541 [Psilocybe cf. subviscida]|uniref:Uncharacterized protein n=1 Tax=Psilocybe cf. subviscida TaxID=2480587 RepID=A0A8H5AS68_9AGAR|nr:hypothetical protein D9619_010541 [Psilocybe cf. subviscida]